MATCHGHASSLGSSCKQSWLERLRCCCMADHSSFWLPTSMQCLQHCMSYVQLLTDLSLHNCRRCWLWPTKQLPICCKRSTIKLVGKWTLHEDFACRVHVSCCSQPSYARMNLPCMDNRTHCNIPASPAELPGSSDICCQSQTGEHSVAAIKPDEGGCLS